MLSFQRFCYRALAYALVKRWIRSCARARPERERRRRRSQRARNRGIESTAEIRADRYVRAHAESHGGLKDVVELLDSIDRLDCVLLVFRRPVARDLQLTIPPDGPASRWQL